MPRPNPSEKMSQLGLTDSSCTRPVSRSKKVGRSMTLVPPILRSSSSSIGMSPERRSRTPTTISSIRYLSAIVSSEPDSFSINEGATACWAPFTGR